MSDDCGSRTREHKSDFCPALLHIQRYAKQALILTVASRTSPIYHSLAMHAWNTFYEGQLLHSGLGQHRRYVCYTSFLIIAWCPSTSLLQLPELSLLITHQQDSTHTCSFCSSIEIDNFKFYRCQRLTSW